MYIGDLTGAKFSGKNSGIRYFLSEVNQYRIYPKGKIPNIYSLVNSTKSQPFALLFFPPSLRGVGPYWPEAAFRPPELVAGRIPQSLNSQIPEFLNPPLRPLKVFINFFNAFPCPGILPDWGVITFFYNISK
ncbi:hypothetical protein D1BOALGB6SA_1053 [Olavius sp. associated proteobacterium Delta 1]|nr:hypothetical protein D1BOALGB6SA_1053 [Olavius sp. associated proteobacterium Delta 1]